MLRKEIERKFPSIYADFIRELFDRFNGAKIKYCILRNYENFPYPIRLSSDYDVLIDKEFFSEVIALVDRLASQFKLTKLLDVHRSSGDIRSQYFSYQNEVAFHIDVMKAYTWRVFEIFNAGIVLREAYFDKTKEVYIPKKGHEAVVSLFGYLFFRGEVKPEYIETIRRNINNDEESFLALLKCTYSEKRVLQLRRLIKKNNWSGVSKWAKYSKYQFWYRFKQCNFSYTRILKYLRKRLFNNTGFFICILGPDGSGKSSVIDELQKNIEPIFGREACEIYHWRPFLLPAVNRRSPGEDVVSNPHEKKPYSLILSLLRYFYFLVDFIIGIRVKVLPKTKLSKMIIFDRYYYDMYIDMLRFRLKMPKVIIKTLGFMVPKPDLLVYIDRDVDSIRRDKPELSRTELLDQKKQFKKLVESFEERGLSTNMNGTIEENALDIRKKIYEILSKRMEG